MKLNFTKKKLSFALCLILFICVLPINYPITKVEASHWIDPPSDSEYVTQNLSLTSDQSLSFSEKGKNQYVDEIHNGGSLTISSNFWVTGVLENTGGLFVDGNLYAHNISFLTGMFIVRDEGIVNSDLTIDGNGSVTINGVLNGDVTINSNSSLIIYGNVNGNIISNEGDVVLQGGTVTGNISTNSGDVSCREDSVINGDVSTNSGEVYLDEDAAINGKVTSGSNAVIIMYGKADSIIMSSWGYNYDYIHPNAIINTIEIQPGKEGTVLTGDNNVFLPENTKFVNHSGIDGLVVTVLNMGYDNRNFFEVNNNQTFSYNADVFNNLCKIEKDFGTFYYNDNSSGSFSLTNPFFDELTYHIEKDSLYPFVLDASVQKGLSPAEYGEEDGTDLSNTDVYVVKVSANSTKEIKVTLAEDYKQEGKVKVSASDILIMILNNNSDVGSSYAKLNYNNFASSIVLGANVEEYIPEAPEKKEGEGSISVKNVNYGSTPRVNITSKTNNASKATVIYKGNGYSSEAAPKQPGTYTVTATLPENDEYKELVLTASFSIGYLPVPTEVYTLSGSKGNNGFYTESVTIKAPNGYQISTSLNGEYTDSLTVSDETNIDKIYLRNADGEMTDGITVDKILIDSKDPLISSDLGDKLSESAIISVSDENLDKIYVNGEKIHFEGLKKEINLTMNALNAKETFEIKAVDKSGRENTYTVTLVSEWYQKGIVPIGGKVKLEKGKKLTLGAGVIGVEGDSTTYSAGVAFYPSEDGEYVFK